jgi:predicted TIM-barrel fold metal-dependent hydrolase
MHACFFKDAVGVQLLDKVGVDNILFETDYPHQDGTWPHSVKAAEEQFGHLDQTSRWKLARGNAIKLFGLDLTG